MLRTRSRSAANCGRPSCKDRPAPHCPGWPYIWSQQTRVRVGDDGKVPVGTQRHPKDAPPRTPILRSPRPDGDSYSVRYAPDPQAKPIVLLLVPVS